MIIIFFEMFLGYFKIVRMFELSQWFRNFEGIGEFFFCVIREICIKIDFVLDFGEWLKDVFIIEFCKDYESYVMILVFIGIENFKVYLVFQVN